MLGTNYTHPPLFVTFSLPRRPALPSPNLVATGSRRRGRPKLDHEVDNVRFSRAIILLDCTRVQRNLTLISFTHSPIRSLSWSPLAGFSAGLSPAQSLETPFFPKGGTTRRICIVQGSWSSFGGLHHFISGRRGNRHASAGSGCSFLPGCCILYF